MRARSFDEIMNSTAENLTQNCGSGTQNCRNLTQNCRNIRVNFIPVEQMRYSTLDDYQIDPDGVLNITIAGTPDGRSNLALLIHALIEQFKAEQAGIMPIDVDRWDLSHPNSEEPAEEPGCPYRDAHDAALFAERAAAASLGLDWIQHTKNLEDCING